MTLTVTYTGQLAEAAGTSEEELEIESGEKLRSVIDTLAERHGEKFSTLLRDDSGQVRSTVLVVLDGAQATGDKDDLPLKDVRDLMLMTPIAGG